MCKQEASSDNLGYNPDPFLFKNTNITSGVGKAMVLAVGSNSQVDSTTLPGLSLEHDAEGILGFPKQGNVMVEPWNTQFRLSMLFFWVFFIAAVVQQIIKGDDGGLAACAYVAEALLVASILCLITVYSYLE